MLNKEYILWDWNGTLLDDLQLNLDIENVLLTKRGLPPLPSREFYLENFGFPIVDFYVLTGFDFQKEPYEAVADDYAAEYEKRLNDVFLFDDTAKVLDELNRRGLKQVIISATNQNVLLRQVEHFGIADKFQAIIGTQNNLGFSKVQFAVKWMQENNVIPDRALFIGDTQHDCETAKAIGCDCFLVATGHNSKNRLIKTGCETFDSLTDVLERLTKN